MELTNDFQDKHDDKSKDKASNDNQFVLIHSLIFQVVN